MEHLLYKPMKSTIKFICLYIALISICFYVLALSRCNAQKIETVIKVNSLEREKIEQWTLQNTFPDIIIFIKDADGNYIVGKEVLRDPAYKELCDLNGTQKPLADFLVSKSDTTAVYKPRTETIKTAESAPK